MSGPDAPIYTSTLQLPASEGAALQAQPLPISGGLEKIGSAIEQFGNEASSVYQKVQHAQQETQSALVRTEYLGWLADKQKKYANDPDFATAPDRFAQENREKQAELAGQITDPQVRALTALHMTIHGVTAQKGIETDTHRKGNDAARASDLGDEQANLDAVRNAGSAVEREAAYKLRDSSIDSLANAGWYSAQERVLMKIRFRERAEAAARDGDTAALFGNLADAEAQTRRATAIIDPSNPEVDTLVAQGVERRVALLQSAAAVKTISQTAAEKSIAATRNDSWSNLVLARAGKLATPDEIAKFADGFSADFAAGKYDGKLDAAGYDTVAAGLGKLAGRADTAARSAATGLGKSIDDFVKREAAGMTPGPGEWDALTAAAHQVPGGDSLILAASDKRDLAKRINAGSVEQGDVIMQGLRERYRANGGIDATRAEVLRFGDALVKDDRALLRTDMLGAALKKGRIESIAPLDFEGFAQTGDAGALADQVRARATQAASVAQSLERTPQYFRPEEKERLKEVFAQGGDAALKLASALVQGGGAQAPAMLHQLGDDAPRLAQAGVILNAGGSLAAARDLAEFQGVKGHDLPKVTEADQKSTDAATVGQAYLATPGDRIRVLAAAEAIARVRIGREGFDASLDTKKAKDIYTRALQEASGASFVDGKQYGGLASYSTGWFGCKAQVVAPPGVRADRMRDLVTAITDADLKNLPDPPQRVDGRLYSAHDLQAAIPLKVPGGYAFASKNYLAGGEMQFISDARGKPWRLDWDAIEPALRGRVPTAFLGGS